MFGCRRCKRRSIHSYGKQAGTDMVQRLQYFGFFPNLVHFVILPCFYYLAGDLLVLGSVHSKMDRGKSTAAQTMGRYNIPTNFLRSL